MRARRTTPKNMEALRDDDQRAALKWMIDREATGGHAGGILADDVGKGKTYVACALVQQSPLWPTLIAVPKATLWDWLGVLQHVVTDEMPCVVYQPNKSAISNGYNLVVVTHASLARRVVDPVIADRKWGRVIVDEAHLFRNPSTFAFKTIKGMRAHAKWALTATPMQNKKGDLLALATCFIGINTTDTDLVRSAFTMRRTGASTDAPLDVSDIMVASPTATPYWGGDGEERPWLTVLSKHGSFFNHADEVQGEVQGEGDEEGDESRDHGSKAGNVAGTVMEAIMRLRQLATHPTLFHRSMAVAKKRDGDADGVIYHMEAASMHSAAASPKIRALVAELQDADGTDEKSLVFCDWLDEMDIIRDALDDCAISNVRYDGSLSVMDRENVLRRFRSSDDDGPRVLIIQMNCGACGINLQAASRVYIMRPQWNPAIEYQAIGRSHRAGQTHRVTVRRFVARGTVDELIRNRQRDKVKCITDALGDDAMAQRIYGSDNHLGSDDKAATLVADRRIVDL